MLKIRLRRSGKKNQPQYRIVVAEHTAPVSGKFVEKLGHYNPHTKSLTLDKEKVLAWINKGAQPSNSLAKLMKKAQISHPNVQVKINAKRATKKPEESTEPKTTAPATEDKTETTPETPATEEIETQEEPTTPESSETSN
jgi:small subunit ribosomal protein S16